MEAAFIRNTKVNVDASDCKQNTMPACSRPLLSMNQPLVKAAGPGTISRFCTPDVLLEPIKAPSSYIWRAPWLFKIKGTACCESATRETCPFKRVRYCVSRRRSFEPATFAVATNGVFGRMVPSAEAGDDDTELWDVEYEPAVSKVLAGLAAPYCAPEKVVC